MTFDAWEVGVGPTEDRLMHWGIQAIGPSEDVLMHEGVKGMKHGRRRYQLEDGTWTEEGLRERRKREGFGDSRAERKAAKKAERDQRRSEKNEARQERSAARKVAVQEATQKLKNKVKKNDIKDLSDEELQKRIARVKMEQEYRELTKSPILKMGEKMVNDYLANKKIKAERAYEDKKLQKERDYEEKRTNKSYEHEMAKMKEQTEQAKIRKEETLKRAEADMKRAEADKTRAETDKVDIQSGTRMRKLKNEAQSNKLQRNRWVSDYTIRGGVKRAFNRMLGGYGEAKAGVSWGKADAKIATAQDNIVRKYNKKHFGRQVKVPEGGYDYVEKAAGKYDKEKKKKKGGD